MNITKQTKWKFGNTVVVSDHITDVDGSELASFHNKDRTIFLGHSEDGDIVLITPETPIDANGNLVGVGIMFMDTEHLDSNAAAFARSLREYRAEKRKEGKV